MSDEIAVRAIIAGLTTGERRVITHSHFKPAGWTVRFPLSHLIVSLVSKELLRCDASVGENFFVPTAACLAVRAALNPTPERTNDDQG